VGRGPVRGRGAQRAGEHAGQPEHGERAGPEHDGQQEPVEQSVALVERFKDGARAKQGALSRQDLRDGGPCGGREAGVAVLRASRRNRQHARADQYV